MTAEEFREYAAWVRARVLAGHAVSTPYARLWPSEEVGYLVKARGYTRHYSAVEEALTVFLREFRMRVL